MECVNEQAEQMIRMMQYVRRDPITDEITGIAEDAPADMVQLFSAYMEELESPAPVVRHSGKDLHNAATEKPLPIREGDLSGDGMLSVCGGIRPRIEVAEPLRRDRFTAQPDDFEIVTPPPAKDRRKKAPVATSNEAGTDKA